MRKGQFELRRTLTKDGSSTFLLFLVSNLRDSSVKFDVCQWLQFSQPSSFPMFSSDVPAAASTFARYAASVLRQSCFNSITSPTCIRPNGTDKYGGEKPTRSMVSCDFQQHSGSIHSSRSKPEGTSMGVLHSPLLSTSTVLQKENPMRKSFP